MKLRSPGAPRALRITGACDTPATLTWQPRRAGPYAAPLAYVVYRNGIPVTITAGTTFTDQQALSSVSYTVQAVNAVGLSPLSRRMTRSCVSDGAGPS